MAMIKFTIEGWTHRSYEDEIEIPDKELEGLSPAEREKHIGAVVEDAVNNVVSWGWEEVTDE